MIKKFIAWIKRVKKWRSTEYCYNVMEDRLEVGYVVQTIQEMEIPTVAVGRVIGNGKLQIIKTFVDVEAERVYRMLVTPDEKNPSKDKIMQDKLVIGAVFPEGQDMYVLSIGRVVNKKISLVNMFEGTDALELYTLLAAREEEKKDDTETDAGEGVQPGEEEN